MVIGSYGVMSHLDMATLTPGSAGARFDKARDRFVGVEPLVRLAQEQGASGVK